MFYAESALENKSYFMIFSKWKYSNGIKDLSDYGIVARQALIARFYNLCIFILIGLDSIRALFHLDLGFTIRHHQFLGPETISF